MDQLRRRLTFLLERLVQRGAFHQLLLMAALVALVAVVGGLAAWALTPAFDGPLVAVWWAFLRLTDPGYLGDDEGAILRTISTIVTVLGYVLFMGSLIAIMTQWLARTIRGLESGLTPIVMHDHIVILGWTNRTPETVVRLLRARGRLQRFLANRQISALRVVIVADEVDAARRLELCEYLGPDWNERQIFLRSGSSLQPAHLERVDLARASVVLVPGADFAYGGAELNDTRVVKTLMTIDALLSRSPHRPRPSIVAEIFDPLKVPLALECINGPLQMIASDQIISRLIYQNLRHHEVVGVLLDLFTHRQGNSIYTRGFPELAGRTVASLIGVFPDAIVLGVLRQDGAELRVHLDPTHELTLSADDVLILLGNTYDSCKPMAPLPAAVARHTAIAVRPPSGRVEERRILVLGWSHKVDHLLVELNSMESRRFDVLVMSKVDIAERERVLKHHQHLERVQVTHVTGDYASAEALGAINPAEFDSVLFLASGWMRSSEQADARTILGYLLLESMVSESPNPPEILVELLDPDNGPLLADKNRAVLVSPRILSHLLAHVAMRPELNAVLDALLGAGGTELASRDAADFDLLGREVAFLEVQQAAVDRGFVAIGLINDGGKATHVNPPRDRRWTLQAGDRLVVLELCVPGLGG